MYEDRPQLVLASQWLIFNAFMLMHMMRTSNGFGPNPLTMAELNAYEARFGKLPIDDDLFVKIVKRIDGAALEWISKKREKKGSNSE